MISRHPFLDCILCYGFYPNTCIYVNNLPEDSSSGQRLTTGLEALAQKKRFSLAFKQFSLFEKKSWPWKQNVFKDFLEECLFFLVHVKTLFRVRGTRGCPRCLRTQGTMYCISAPRQWMVEDVYSSVGLQYFQNF